jgi:hypothetical protein
MGRAKLADVFVPGGPDCRMVRLILMVAKAMMKRKEDETDKRFASLGSVEGRNRLRV